MSQLSIETPSQEDTRLPLQQEQQDKSSSALNELLGLEVSAPIQDIFQLNFQQQQHLGNFGMGQQNVNQGKRSKTQIRHAR